MIYLTEAMICWRRRGRSCGSESLPPPLWFRSFQLQGSWAGSCARLPRAGEQRLVAPENAAAASLKSQSLLAANLSQDELLLATESKLLRKILIVDYVCRIPVIFFPFFKSKIGGLTSFLYLQAQQMSTCCHLKKKLASIPPLKTCRKLQFIKRRDLF